MTKIIFANLWFFAAICFLIICATYFTYPYAPKNWNFLNKSIVLGLSHTPPSTNTVEATATDLQATKAAALAQTADARAKIVANFIERNDRGNNSPLQPYDYWGKVFVEVADEFGLDFRLLPAIARKESTFCKSNIAKKYYNCFGYGVPASGITEAGKFTSYEQGIRVVASSLKRSYLDKGLTDPEAIMAKYCPPSAEGGGAWAKHLNQWMTEMRFDEKNIHQDLITNINLEEFTP